MAATEYAVRINSKEGALEIVGPEKDWVDAKLEQLSSVFEDYSAEASEEGSSKGPAPKPRKPPGRKKAAPAAAAADASDKPAPRRARTGSRAEVNDELAVQLSAEVKKDLGEYVAARQKAWNASQPAQAAIIATFLYDRVNWPGVDRDDLYTVYNAMGWKSPRNMRSQLVNARQRDRYFGSISNGKAMLSHHGENFGRHDSIDDEDADS
jgi:hypothetical protein